MVELGCGSAQKTSILLNELLARDGSEQVLVHGVRAGLLPQLPSFSAASCLCGSLFE